MIYEYPEATAPIRQGDVFIGLPRVELSLRQLPILNERGQAIETTWRDTARANEVVAAVLPVRPVPAIVATQDCDTLRGRDITLCEIRPFRDVEGKATKTTSPKKWKNIITQHARINQKWFYLPPDERVGFADKMAVDFRITICVPRIELEGLRDLRRGRLNNIADEHFRERIAEFFRRYPYDEWYPLEREELDAYQSDYPDAKAFPWQETG